MSILVYYRAQIANNIMTIQRQSFALRWDISPHQAYNPYKKDLQNFGT